MVNKTSKEICNEVEEARKHIESISMIIDAAEAHFIIESLVEALKSTAVTFVQARDLSNSKFNDKSEKTLELMEASRELTLTGISALKTFVGSLPKELNLVEVHLDRLALIEEILRED